MSKIEENVFNIKAGDKIRLRGQDCFRVVKSAHLGEEKVGVARTILITFNDDEKAKYTIDGVVSCANKKKYYHDIVEVCKGIRAGQIYKRPNGVILLITETDPRTEEIVVREQKETLTGMYSYITPKGYISSIAECVLDGLEFIAEYPTWQEAVNSKEFKNGKIS